MPTDFEPLPDEESVALFLETQLGRFTKNLARAGGLVKLYEILVNVEDLAVKEGGTEDVTSDILRSAVVFSHATLEDLLRSIARVLLPYSEEATLSQIPLAGTSGSGRPEKFLLGKLAAHRGKSVLELIQESVAEHLLTTTYNDTTQISVLLSSIKIDLEGVRHLFPQLDALIKRRHQIVHRADRAHSKGFEVITSDQVQEWIDVVMDFMSILLSDIVTKKLPKEV